jgi:hypothetical protein
MIISSLLRSATALFLVAILAGCGGGGGAVMPNPAVQNAVVPQAAAPAGAGNPCIISGMWYFHGHCIEQHIDRSGTTFALASYKHIDATLVLPTNDARANAEFLLGEGTSRADITGTYDGKRFPEYGTTKCIRSSTGKTLPCYGKPLVYLLFYNAGRSTVTFDQHTGFAFTISAKTFPGKACQLNGWAPSAWYEYQVYGRVTNGRIQMDFDPQGALKFAPNVFELFAVSCK